MYDILKSTNVKFIIIRYAAFVIQAIGYLFFAKYLGVYYFGLFSFFNLVIQYLSLSSLGLNYSITVTIAGGKTGRSISAGRSVYTSIVILLVVGLVLFLIAMIGNQLYLFESLSSYKFNEYCLYIALIGTICNLNMLFINIFRIYSRLWQINIYFLIVPITQVLCIFFFKEEKLFWALLSGFGIGNLISLALFIYAIPSEAIAEKEFSKSEAVKLVRRGIMQLAYNYSLLLVSIAARSLVGYLYSVEQFGFFNFAQYLTSAMMMFLGTINFLIYPKMLNKFANCLNREDIVLILKKSREIFLTLACIVFYFSLIIMPIVFLFLPEYKQTLSCFKYLLIAQIILSNSFGFSTLLIQQEKEKVLTIVGAIAIIIVIAMGYFFGAMFAFSYEYIAVACIMSSIVYTHLIILLANNITKQFSSHFSMMKYIYRPRYFFPVIALFVLNTFRVDNNISSIITVVFFILMNYKNIANNTKMGLSIVKNNKSLAL